MRIIDLRSKISVSSKAVVTVTLHVHVKHETFAKNALLLRYFPRQNRFIVCKLCKMLMLKRFANAVACLRVK